MWMIVLATAAVGLGRPALMDTAPPPPSGPAAVRNAKAPASKTAEALKAWAKANIDWGKDGPIGGGPSGVIALRAGGLAVTPEGYLRGWIRTETTAPVNARPGLSIRSGQSLSEFDCSGRRMRDLVNDLHRDSNLQGPGVVDETNGRAWRAVKPKTQDDMALRAICGLRQRQADAQQAQTRTLALIDPPPSPPPGDNIPRSPPAPTAADPEAVKAWIEANIAFGGDSVAGQNPTGVLLVRPYTARRTIEGLVQVWQRFESFAPRQAAAGTPTRSAQMQWEFDCAGKRTRQTAAIEYPFSNLQGAPSPGVSPAGWEAVAAGGLLGRELEQLCGAREHMPVLSPAPAPAAAGADRPLSPPTDTSPAAVLAWAQAHLDMAGLRPMALSAEGVDLVDTASVSGPPDGVRRARIRSEFFTAHHGPVVTRSMLRDKSYDCAAGRFRVTRVEVFPFNNLKGQGASQDNPDSAAWQTPRAGTMEAQELALMCPKPQARPEPSPPPAAGSQSL